MRLLIIEDNTRLREAVCQYLREADFVVDTASTGDEGLWAARENPYDLILLDLMLPEIDGMEILRQLRSCGRDVHVLVISARDGLEDRLAALDAGADDYLVKPFHLSEALARIRALLRRSYVKKDPVIRCGDLSLNSGNRSVQRGERMIDLTPLEFRLLEYLLFRTSEVVSRTEIWEKIFEDGSGGISNTVDVYIGYLRKKLNADGEINLIHTRRGHGYMIGEVAP